LWRQFVPKETRTLVDRQIVACRNFLKHLEVQHAPEMETGEGDGAFLSAWSCVAYLSDRVIAGLLGELQGELVEIE